MSNNLSHKMINVEIPPPASAWEKIAAELEKLNHPQFIDVNIVDDCHNFHFWIKL